MKSSDLKKKLLKKDTPKILGPNDFLSSGSTLLNLACTDTAFGCFVKGRFHSLVGDSDTGKSILALTTLCEAAINEDFDDYALVYNNAERGMLMDVTKHFPPLAPRLKIEMSESPEEFYFNLDDYVKQSPCVYILDSMDALIAEADEKKFQKQKTAHKKDKEESGSYGTQKAKINANNLNRACSKIEKNGSILIIISQTHDNLGFGAMFGNKKTRSGGRALKFYNRAEVWLSVKETLFKSYKGKKIQIGSLTKAAVQKNHVTGKRRTVEIPIYNGYGVDDVGSCIDYLVEMKHWGQKGNTVDADEYEFNGPRDELIAKIEKNPVRKKKLQKLTRTIWRNVEKAIELDRAPKYDAY